MLSSKTLPKRGTGMYQVGPGHEIPVTRDDHRVLLTAYEPIPEAFDWKPRRLIGMIARRRVIFVQEPMLALGEIKDILLLAPRERLNDLARSLGINKDPDKYKSKESLLEACQRFCALGDVDAEPPKPAPIMRSGAEFMTRPQDPAKVRPHGMTQDEWRLTGRMPKLESAPQGEIDRTLKIPMDPPARKPEDPGFGVPELSPDQRKNLEAAGVTIPAPPPVGMNTSDEEPGSDEP